MLLFYAIWHMDRLDEEAFLHRHIIISPAASSLPLKLVTPMRRGLSLEDGSCEFASRRNTETEKHGETAIIGKWIVSTLFLMLSGAAVTQ